MSYPSWIPVSLPGTVAQLVTAENGNGWVLDTNGIVHKYANNSWQSIPGTQSGTVLISLSAAVDGSAIARDNANNVYVFDPSTYSWTLQGHGTAIAIGDKDNYIISNGASVQLHQYGSTQVVYPPAPLVHISATAGLSHIWGVDTNNQIVTYSGVGTWTTVPGPGTTVNHIDVSIASDGFSRQLYAVGSDGYGYWYSGGSWVWVDNPSYFVHSFVNIEGGAGFVWGLLSDGSLYQGTI